MFEAIERVLCDRCGARGPEVLESESAIEAAQAEGWVCAEEDLCPTCAMQGWESELREALDCLPGVDTLATRNSDRLDFHEVAVWALRDALVAAYHAGRKHEREKGETDRPA